MASLKILERAQNDEAKQKLVPPSTADGPIAPNDPLTGRLIRRFFLLTFLIGWGLSILMMIFSEQVEAMFGEIGYTNPVFILVVWSPAIAAFYLVWRNYGWSGVRSFARRATMWRMPLVWWALLVLGVPAIVYAGALFAGTAGESEISPWYGVLGALALTMVVGPVEEFGWRGLALPLLQRRHTPVVAGLIVGSLWGLWHAPAFLFSGTKQASWSFPVFVVGVLALAVIITPMFNAAKGSILIPALFHFQVNGPIWPDAEPWDTVVYAAVAVVVLVLNRKTMFKPTGVTDVLMEPAPAGASDRGGV